MNLAWLRKQCWEDRDCYTYAGPMPLDLKSAARVVTGKGVPPGKRILQNCGNALCCNPEHFELAEEVLDPLDHAPGPLKEPDTISVVPEPEKDHDRGIRLCRAGHPIEGSRCRICYNEYQANYMRQRRAKN